VKGIEAVQVEEKLLWLVYMVWVEKKAFVEAMEGAVR
jgi:hypothetical protein